MRALLVGLALVASCGGGSGSAKSGAQCGFAPGVGTGLPGACAAGRALLSCESPMGGGCTCVTDDVCGGCDIVPCVNKCKAGEYAVACGGPPNPNITYDDPPAGCRADLPTPAGSVFYCCPCR
jgi:hypothetical protein